MTKYLTNIQARAGLLTYLLVDGLFGGHISIYSRQRMLADGILLRIQCFKNRNN